MKSLSLTTPHFLVVVGLPGSGKTFFAEKFAETFHAPYLTEEAILPYAANTKAADALFYQQLDQLTKTKQSIVIDGKSATRAERIELAKKAKAEGYESLLIWVQTDPQTTKIRAAKAQKSDDAYTKETKRFSAPVPPEKSIVISGKHTYASQAKVVLKKLSTPRAETSTRIAPPARPQHQGRRSITIR